MTRPYGTGLNKKRRRRRWWVLAGTLAALVVLGATLRVAGSLPSKNLLSDAPQSVAPEQSLRQPDVHTYEYLLSEERYVLPHDDGSVEVQERRRESWRSPDGWAWAQQTGFDPGWFIFGPTLDWEPLRQVNPNPGELSRVLRKMLSKSSASALTQAEFGYVDTLLGAETLPAGSLPRNYRIALIQALEKDRAAVVTHDTDPLGRNALRVGLLDPGRPDVVRAFFLTPNDYQYLASTTSVKGSSESGVRTIVRREERPRIPEDLLAKVGSTKTRKEIWK